MRIRHQLYAAVGVAALAATLIFAALIAVTRDNAARMRQQADAQEVARDLANLLTLTNEFSAYGGERAAAQWRLRHGQLRATVARALQGEPDPQSSALPELRRTLDNLPALFGKLIELAGEPASPLRERRKELLVERLLSETQELVEARHRWALALTTRQAREQDFYNAMVLGAPALLLLVVAALAALVGRRVLRPLARLQAAADAVRAGALGVRVDLVGDDELADMARAFDAMAASVQQQTAAVQSANRLLEAEVARRRDSERRLRAVTDHLPAQIAHIGADEHYLFCNAAVGKVLGFTPDALVGRALREARGEAFYRSIEPHLRRVLAGEAVEFEVGSARSGRPRTYQSVFIPDLDDAGAVRGFYSMSFDITDRKLTETKLAASEERLRAIADNVPALIGYIDAEGCYRFVNRAYERWHGRTADALHGTTVRSLHGDANYALLQPQLERALAGEVCDFDVELTRADGVHAMHVAYVPDRGADGTVRGVYALKSDVTALRESRQRLQLVMDNVPALISYLDGERRYRLINREYREWHGMPEASILGRRVDDFYGAEQRRRWLPYMERALAGETVSYDFEAIRHGTPRALHVSYIPQRDAAGRVQGLHSLAFDVTELRGAERQLRATSDELQRSNQELEQFAYVASHDLQEPLRMVTSYAQLLQRRHGAKFDGEAREFLDFMTDGAKRAQALIGDLLQLARVNSQARPFAPVPLAEVLGDTLQSLRLAVAESGARITHDALPVVDADRRQIGQLLQNLVGNALKFRGARAPQVHLSAARDADSARWRIEVRDNGIGIDPQFHQRVFVLFQRLHLRGEYAGTGIGLAVCKKVVERHGGRIGVESVPGQGAAFWFTLPDAGAELAR
jgi:PAS domain S-box-containing protein